MNQIPSELRALPQWLVSGQNKIPISPKTKRAADVRNPELFTTFEHALDYAQSHALDIGFVLTPDDPYTVIDLDSSEATVEQQERHRKIYDAFDTYAELSRSRGGVHIWCRGSVPSGSRRDKVEIYSAHRYMITTGLVLKARPIADCQDLLDTLWSEMGQRWEVSDLEDVDELLDDRDVYEMAMRAANAEKFDRLARGEWQQEYPSQSEADFALMNMLCFYTRSNEQAKRLFRYSALGRRDKAQREDYLNYMIRKIRAEQAPRIDFSALKPIVVNQNGSNVPEIVDGEVEMPAGLVRDIAEYIYSSSIRPVKEISMVAAIGLCAGIVGRQFNISGTGLNQYLILLAKTGVGKEAVSDGISRLLASVREKVPAVNTFRGPAAFASGQAIIRKLDEQACFVSVLGEFGLTLQTLSSNNANANSLIYRRVLLDLYSKSGRTAVLQSSAYSDKEKNTKTLFAPALTIVGESTPETFYGGLSEQQIEDGLIPRFLIIEYKGDRPTRNKNAGAAPDDGLVQRVADLATVVLQMSANQTWQDVQLSEGAKRVLDEYDAECDDRIRKGESGAQRQLWNRAHLKALRLAGLLAAADRPHEPIVSEEEALWAVQVVRGDTAGIAERFARGDVGDGLAAQVAEMTRLVKEYVERPYKAFEKNKDVKAEWHKDRVISLAYLQSRCYQLNVFKNDRRGARVAVKDALEVLIEMEALVEVPKQQVVERFKCRRTMFHVPGD